MREAVLDQIRAVFGERQTLDGPPPRVLTTPNAPVQLNRRASLRIVLGELAWAGVSSTAGQAALLGLRPGKALAGFLRGDPISDAVAREIEWAMQRRDRWMDEDHRDPPGDD
jgi:hypothetical protein